MFFGHLEQLLSWKQYSKRLYLEIAVKFSSQEHTRPPRIQEEKIGFDSKFPKSRLDLMGKLLQDQFLTSNKPRGWPQIWLLNPILEGEMRWSQNFSAGADNARWGQNFFFPGFVIIIPNFWNGFQPGSATFEKWSLNSIRSLTIHVNINLIFAIFAASQAGHQRSVMTNPENQPIHQRQVGQRLS